MLRLMLARVKWSAQPTRSGLCIALLAAVEGVWRPPSTCADTRPTLGTSTRAYAPFGNREQFWVPTRHPVAVLFLGGSTLRPSGRIDAHTKLHAMSDCERR